MPTAVLERSIVATSAQIGQARELETQWSDQPEHSSDPVTIPPELRKLLRQVVTAVARDKSVTIVTSPEEVTTTEAARELGISRPTLMKMIRSGEIPAHMVGTHHRIKHSDVVEARRRQVAKRRKALEELMALSDEIGDI